MKAGRACNLWEFAIGIGIREREEAAKNCALVKENISYMECNVKAGSQLS